MPSESKRPRESATAPRTAAEVDRILDKISAHGIHSLTRAEQKTLERVSKTRNTSP